MPDGADGTAAGLRVVHAAELIPAGPEQCRHLPPPGDRFCRVAPMFQSVLVAWRRTAAFSPTVKPTAGPPRHSRRLARHPAPIPGTASWAPMHGQVAVHGVDPPFSMPPP